MNTSKYIKAVASMLGDKHLDLFADKVVRSLKNGDVDGIKGAVKLLSELLDASKDAEDAEDITPTENNRVRITLAFRLKKDKRNKIHVSDIQTTGIGNREADEDIDEMRKVLCAIVTDAIHIFVKCYREGEEQTLDLYNTIVKHLDDDEDEDND